MQQQQDMFGMLRNLMSLGQMDQQMRQGEQQLQQGPEEHALGQRMKQAQLEHLQGENQMQPLALDEARFSAEHRPETYDSQALAAKLHAMASLGQSGMLLPDAVDPVQMKMLLQKQLGFTGDPVGDEVTKRLESLFPKETAAYKTMAQQAALKATQPKK